jgi:hypothetical protein
MNINSEDLLHIIKCLKDALGEYIFYFQPPPADDSPDYSKQIIDSITLLFLEYYLTPTIPSKD